MLPSIVPPGHGLANVGVVTTLISKAQFNSRNTVAMNLRARGNDALHRAGIQKTRNSHWKHLNFNERNMKCAVVFADTVSLALPLSARRAQFFLSGITRTSCDKRALT
jgi:hypothetical protein